MLLAIYSEVGFHQGSVLSSHLPISFLRYPVVLQCFHLNKGTGGDGVWRGGEGVVREMMFRQPLTLSVLTERRNYRPFGLEGECACVRL